MKLNKDKETLDQVAPLVEYAFLKNNDIRRDSNFLSRYNHSMGFGEYKDCLLYTSPSPRDGLLSRMPSSA